MIFALYFQKKIRFSAIIDIGTGLYSCFKFMFISIQLTLFVILILIFLTIAQECTFLGDLTNLNIQI
jgi:hypothetical protein